MNRDAAVAGHWVTLEPLSDANRLEVARIAATRHRTPNLGGAPGRRDVSRPFGPAMLIRANADGAAIGVIENGQMSGYPGVAVVLIFVDESVARPGVAMEAFAIYVARVFAAGARLVHIEVLEFNTPVLRMLARIGVDQQARLRHQAYAAGRFWDVLVFAFDAEKFQNIVSRYARKLPGGDRRPAALGGKRKP